VHTLALIKCITLNDKIIKAISLYLKNLKVLYLSFYFQMIIRNGLLCIAELVNLQILNLSQNISVGDDVLIAIGAQCKQLRNVDISRK
jgi:hypothetical protein